VSDLSNKVRKSVIGDILQIWRVNPDFPRQQADRDLEVIERAFFADRRNDMCGVILQVVLDRR
jgi:hypothetical protein